MQALAAANEKASYRRLLAERLEQFQTAVAQFNHDKLYLLLLDDFLVADFEPEDGVEGFRSLQAFYRNAEMIDGGGIIFQQFVLHANYPHSILCSLDAAPADMDSLYPFRLALQSQTGWLR